jgi:hypothetical protein
MQNDETRIFELHLQGFHCAQILLIMGLEHQGKENPDLIRAMNGLAGGLGFQGKNCAALSGGACLLALFAGRGKLEEAEHRSLNLMIQQLVEWFEVRFGTEYGGIDCSKILGGDPWNKMIRCPKLVNETFAMVRQLLKENGLAFLTDSSEEDL